MSQIFITNCPLQGLKLIHPFYMEDKRGYFLKSYEKDIFFSLGLDFEIQEDFESLSVKNVVRGLHFQTKNPQDKIVRALSGEVYDVAVDLRKDSPTFGKWHAEILSFQNKLAYYIPAGFAHGFFVLSDTAVVQYKCRGRYIGGADSGIRWNDPDLSIAWPCGKDVIISDRDRLLPTLREFQKSCGGLQVPLYNEDKND